MIKKVRKRLKRQHKKLGSWEKVGRVYGVNKTTLCRFADEEDGYIPKDQEIRKKIGIDGGKEIIVSIRKRNPDGTLAKNEG